LCIERYQTNSSGVPYYEKENDHQRQSGILNAMRTLPDGHTGL
jgi:hypothetical protein